MDSAGHNPTKRDRIPAPLWNRIVQATEQVEQSNHGATGATDFAPRASNLLLAKNTTGSEIPRYGVVKFSGAQTDPAISDDALKAFQERPILTAAAPSSDDISWGIAVDPIKNGEIGRIAIGGVAPVQIDVSDQGHKYAKPKDNSTASIESCAASPSAAAILWKQSGTGLRWGVVRFGAAGGLIKLGKVAQAWTCGTSATVDVYEDGSDGESTTTLTAKNMTRRQVAAESWVMVGLSSDGDWYLLDAGKCDTGCAKPTISGDDLTSLPGYNAAATQVLAHSAGCLQWINTTTCET